MKMTKKLVLAAVAVAAVMFAGCKVGDVEFKTHNSGTGTRTYTVDQTNENDEIIRGIKQVGAANRAGGDCVIKINNQSAKTKDGVAGFIAGYSKDDNGKLSFIVVGVQNNYSERRYYVSTYFNIDPNNINGDNFGVKKGNVFTAKKDASFTEPYEVQVEPWTKIDGLTLKDGVLECAILISTSSSGVVTIKIVKAGDYDVVTQSAQLTLKTGASAVATATVNTDQTPFADASPKGKLCCYANIQPSKTLNAEWAIYGVTFKTTAGYAFEEDDDLPPSPINWK